MTKRFCDKCDIEITNKNSGQLEASIELAGLKYSIDPILKYKNDSSTEKDICIHCIIDAFNKMDDRPKVISQESIH